MPANQYNIRLSMTLMGTIEGYARCSAGADCITDSICVLPAGLFSPVLLPRDCSLTETITTSRHPGEERLSRHSIDRQS